MNTNHFPLDDKELAAALETEDQYAADPRPEHIDELREKLLGRTKPAPQPQPAQPKRRSRVWLIGLPTAAAAALLIMLLSVVSQPKHALADVLAKTRAQKWVHGVMTSTDPNQQNLRFEYWQSPELGITAGQTPQFSRFDDYNLKQSAKYTAETKTIYLVSLLRNDGVVRQPIDAVMRFEIFLMRTGTQFVDHDEVVKGLTKSKVTVDGKSMNEYSFRLVHKKNPQAERPVRVLVNEKTGLLHSWEDKDRGFLTRFDYPDTGPADIYALGIPQDVKLVDRTASSDVTMIAETIKKGRTQFDDYDAIYVGYPEGLAGKLPDMLNLDVKRVRRRGDKFRVDHLLKAKPGVVAPEPDADMHQWWKMNRDNFWSVPMLICDGKNNSFYSLVADEAPIPRVGKPNLEVALRSTSRRSGYPDDRTAPWPHLMPEYASRPHLWTSYEKRTFDFDPVPNDGPADTRRLTIHKPENQVVPEPYRYWFDPEHGFCLRKSESTVISRDKKSIAYVNTEEFDDYAQSPKGYWYPRRVRRTTTNSDAVQVRDYYLDFDVDLHDDLFEPLKLD